MILLGADRHTADCFYDLRNSYILPELNLEEKLYEAYYIIPAWTLGALIRISNSNTYYDDITINENNGVFLFDKGFERSSNIYDNMIDCIEWLIKNNHLKF